MFNTFIPLHFYLCISCWLMRQRRNKSRSCSGRVHQTERELESKKQHTIGECIFLSLWWSAKWINARRLWNWNASRAHIIEGLWDDHICWTPLFQRRAAAKPVVFIFSLCVLFCCAMPARLWLLFRTSRRVLMQIVLYTSDHNMSTHVASSIAFSRSRPLAYLREL